MAREGQGYPCYQHDMMMMMMMMMILEAMCKLSSNIPQNENDTDISLYRMSLQKLNENILKYSRLNFFKEITIGFNNGLQTTSAS